MAADGPTQLKFDVSYAATTTHHVLGTVHLFCVVPEAISSSALELLPAGCLALVQRDPVQGPPQLPPLQEGSRRNEPGIAPHITTIVVGKSMSRGAESAVVSRTSSDLRGGAHGPSDELWEDFCRNTLRQKRPDENMFAGVPQFDLANQLVAKYKRLTEQRDAKQLPPHVLVRRIELRSWHQNTGDTFAAMCEPLDYWRCCHQSALAMISEPSQVQQLEQVADSQELIQPVPLPDDRGIVAEVEDLLKAVAVESDDELQPDPEPAAADSSHGFAAQAAALREAYSLLAALEAKQSAAEDSSLEPPALPGAVASPTDRNCSAAEPAPSAATATVSRQRHDDRCARWLIYVECVDRSAANGAERLQTPPLFPEQGTKSKRREGNKPKQHLPSSRTTERTGRIVKQRPAVSRRVDQLSSGPVVASTATPTIWDASFL